MIDEFDFGLYYSLIEDERFRDHYLENNDDFYTQFLFYEELTEYKSTEIIMTNVYELSPFDILQYILLKKIDNCIDTISKLIVDYNHNNFLFNLKITWEGEEYIFERIENSKIFKRKYLDGE